MSLENFESDFIVFLLNKDRFLKFHNRIKEKHFTNEILRWIFKVIETHYRRYNEIPNLKVFKTEIFKLTVPNNEKKAYYITIKKLLSKKLSISEKYIEDNVREKVEKEEFVESIQKAVYNIEKGDLNRARKDLIQSVLLGKEDKKFPIISVLKDWKSRQVIRKELKKLPSSKRFVSTPYSAINRISSGIQISEAATVAGLTGVGKSIMLGEFGLNSLLENLNVLHFPLENTGEQTAQRYDSRISEIEYDIIKFYRFKGPEIKTFEKIFKVLSSTISGDVKIQETYRNEADFSYIEETILYLREQGSNTDFLIIDSCDIMKSAIRYESYRLDRASIYWDFKDYCKMKRIPGLTTTQLKIGSKGRVATSEDLAESYDKARILDLVYIMSQTEEDRKKNIVRFSLDKNRDGVDGINVNLYKDAAKMRFLEVI